jgi:glutamate synthase domain-containing protein 3
VKFTDSPVAKSILSDWTNELRRFVKVMPNDYRRVLEKQAEIDEQARKLAERQTARV